MDQQPYCLDLSQSGLHFAYQLLLRFGPLVAMDSGLNLKKVLDHNFELI